MNVLSLFDGISCGQIALNRANIKVDNYYASEIDKHAIKVTLDNFPTTIQIGDVLKINGFYLPKIDLLIGGSPCQSFSSSGSRNGFEGKSGLFFEYLRILKEVNPKYFLLENVKMKKEWEDILTNELGVEPILINSSLVSAQNRSRLYWTNIPCIKQPIDKKIGLTDILESDWAINPGAIRGRKLPNGNVPHKDLPYTQCLEVRSTNITKSNCLTTVSKDNVLTNLPIGKYPKAFDDQKSFRYYSMIESCRLQTIPENYFECISSESQIRKMIGNAWTVDIIVEIFKNIK